MRIFPRSFSLPGFFNFGIDDRIEVAVRSRLLPAELTLLYVIKKKVNRVTEFHPGPGR